MTSCRFERRHHLGEIIGVGVHVVAVPGLAGTAMAPAIKGNAAIAVAGQEEHLVFKGVAIEAVGMVEDDGVSLPPILEIKFGTVLRGEGAHGIPLGFSNVGDRRRYPFQGTIPAWEALCRGSRRARRCLLLIDYREQDARDAEEGDGRATQVDANPQTPDGRGRAQEQRNDSLQKIGDQKNR